MFLFVMLINIVLLQEGTNCSNRPTQSATLFAESENNSFREMSTQRWIFCETFPALHIFICERPENLICPVQQTSSNYKQWERDCYEISLIKLSDHTQALKADGPRYGNISDSSSCVWQRVPHAQTYAYTSETTHKHVQHTCSSSQHTHKQTVCVYDVCDPLTPRHLFDFSTVQQTFDWVETKNTRQKRQEIYFKDI